jgi:serine/threonine protein kinase
MRLCFQLLLALQYLHRQRIMHRDLKPANVFLKGREATVVKLGDFGLARSFSSQTAFATTMSGTPYYISPEICLSRPYEFKSDVWALGCGTCCTVLLCITASAARADALSDGGVTHMHCALLQS